MLTITEIMKLLPHRYPMLLVDRVLEIEEGKRIVGLKNVSANEQFFQGHFPGAPVMPGVLIVEAMAQCAAILGLLDLPDREKKLFLFGGVDKARFRRPVVPGDQLVLESENIRVKARTGHVKCRAFVGDSIVAEAIIKFMLVDNDLSAQ